MIFGGTNLKNEVNMARIIGRLTQKNLLEEAYNSEIAEFIAVYGRRRVGKTYLVKQLFENKHNEDMLFFSTTGIKDAPMKEQTKAFSRRIGDVFYREGAPITIQENWFDTFQMLTEEIHRCSQKKIILFLDEFPWMSTRGARLIRTLEYFWNQFWSSDSRIKLIVCGSASSWILNNIVNNKGGLYNRVTRSMLLSPFNLHDTKAYLTYKKVKLLDRDITDLYMVLGGIPFYLNKISSGLSVVQIIEELAFQKDSFLLREFSNLYATLFDAEGKHIELARAISKHRYGIGLDDLTDELDLSRGGRITTWLKELEEAGFITSFTPYGKAYGKFYKMTDEYSLFYFSWIEPIRQTLIEEQKKAGYWDQLQNSHGWYSWAGYSFEAVCYKHIGQIRTALSISPAALAYSWRHVPLRGTEERGAQIDLLFDRNDNSISLCEIKYTRKPYILDKSAADNLNRQVEVFKKYSKTKKNIFIYFVSAAGLKKTLYTEEYVSGVATLQDLFQPA